MNSHGTTQWTSETLLLSYVSCSHGVSWPKASVDSGIWRAPRRTTMSTPLGGYACKCLSHPQSIERVLLTAHTEKRPSKTALNECIDVNKNGCERKNTASTVQMDMQYHHLARLAKSPYPLRGTRLLPEPPTSEQKMQRMGTYGGWEDMAGVHEPS